MFRDAERIIGGEVTLQEFIAWDRGRRGSALGLVIGNAAAHHPERAFNAIVELIEEIRKGKQDAQ